MRSSQSGCVTQLNAYSFAPRKIVLARYGGNFRGYKAHFAEKYGAAGLIIYT
ncbi:MAG: PA domain-containing protein, partial [Phycisphaerales bacterium]